MVLSDLFNIYIGGIVEVNGYDDVSNKKLNLFNSVQYGSLDTIISDYWNCPVTGIEVKCKESNYILVIEINISEVMEN